VEGGLDLRHLKPRHKANKTPKTTAMPIVRFVKDAVSLGANQGSRVYSVWPPAHIDPESGQATRPLQNWEQRVMQKVQEAYKARRALGGPDRRVRVAREGLMEAIVRGDP
jgi:hypothetical protein